MIIYLIKVTLIWALLLVVYRLLYRDSRAFAPSRVYLIVALAAGIILPLLVWSAGWNAGGAAEAALVANDLVATNSLPVANTTIVAHPEISWSTADIIGWLYLAGLVVAALFSFREITLILRTAIYGRFVTINSHRIFSSDKEHAPFSFMGWIFVTRPEHYTTDELRYILKHEDAHNSRKHWLDIIFMQLVFIVFWFHPLVWYYRRLLKMAHEYEADAIAAGDDVYEYGHFLLGQTLLKNTPAIAHSFHFSPIKNRITMLTKTGSTNKWKFALALPVLLGCSVLFAKSGSDESRIRQGNTVIFRGHQFTWGSDRVDSTQVVDPVSNQTTWVVTRLSGAINRVDKKEVYVNEDDAVKPAAFTGAVPFEKYLEQEFAKSFPDIPDSIRMVVISDVVIDEKGKICYYDVSLDDGREWKDAFAAGSPFVSYGKAISRIVDSSPNWTPAFVSGKTVPVFNGSFKVYVRPRSERGVVPAK